jgi:hypothetical protein
MPLPAKNLCGAKTRSGGECTQPAMGNGRCRMHGGRTPRGVAHHSFQHGRYSKSVPARLSQSYEEALNDPKRLELDNELSIVIARNKEILASLYNGDSDNLRRRMREEKRLMEKARREGDNDAAADHLNNIMRMIERGASDGERWVEWMANTDQVRRLTESERKRRVEEHQIVTTEEILAIIGAVLAIITRHVPDGRTRRAIGYDIEALVAGDRKLEPSPEPSDGTPRL